MGTIGLFGIAACVACAGYWYHAGEELGYPRWLGAAVGWLACFGMITWWPGSLLWAVVAQVAAALAVGTVRTIAFRTRR